MYFAQKKLCVILLSIQCRINIHVIPKIKAVLVIIRIPVRNLSRQYKEKGFDCFEKKFWKIFSNKFQTNSVFHQAITQGCSTNSVVIDYLTIFLLNLWNAPLPRLLRLGNWNLDRLFPLWVQTNSKLIC